MANDPTTEDLNKAAFMGMIMMLASSAMQHLGKTLDPQTGKTEVHLDAAQATIDMVLMLQAKTKGNLDRDEQRLLESTLTSLQLNYVETAQMQPPTPPQPQTGGDEPAAAQAAPSADSPSTPAPEAGAKDSKEPKYHKSYGAG